MRRKSIFCILTVCVLLFALSMSVGASGFGYTLDNLRTDSGKISVEVTRAAGSAENAKIYIAVYNDNGIMEQVFSQTLTIAEGTSTTIEKVYNANTASSVKAFVWKSILIPDSETLVRSVDKSGDIEFGGDL